LDRREGHAINKLIHILPSKKRKKLELPGHVIVLGQFDGRRDCNVELELVVTEDSVIEKREEKQRADVSLLEALIP
jgi:hypothetical protein